MNEPNEPGAESLGAVTYVLPESRITSDGQQTVETSGDEVLPAPLQEVVAEEPPIEWHDPFAYMRNAPWMNRKLTPSGRAAILLRRDLDAFPVIEGRDPNHADLDAIVKRTVDYIVPIIKRERATDAVYEALEKRRVDRITQTKEAAPSPVLNFFVEDLPADRQSTETASSTVELASSDGCAQIIEACHRHCTTLYADKGLEALPGSGRDSFGRHRRCVRECVAPSGCSF